MEKRHRRSLFPPSFFFFAHVPAVVVPESMDSVSPVLCVPAPLAAAERPERSDRVSEEAEYHLQPAMLH